MSTAVFLMKHAKMFKVRKKAKSKKTNKQKQIKTTTKKKKQQQQNKKQKTKNKKTQKNKTKQKQKGPQSRESKREGAEWVRKKWVIYDVYYVGLYIGLAINYA